jgi:hypothetical protein
MKVSKSSRPFSIILLVVILLVIVLYFLNSLLSGKFSLKKTPFVGPFFSENIIENADNISNIKTWTFPASSGNWYTITINGSEIKFNSLGITPNNPKVSITFYVRLTSIYNNWRNIFHFTNGGDCCGIGQRIPAVWFHGNCTRLHIRFSTNAGGNDGIDTDNIIPYKTVNGRLIPSQDPVFVAIVFSGDNFKYYLNGTKMYDGNFKGIRTRNENTTLYIGDPFYSTDNGVQISEFRVHDCEITPCEASGTI